MTIRLWSTARTKIAKIRGIGDDGLRDGERAQLAARYNATIGKPPTRSPERTARMRSRAASDSRTRVRGLLG